ncbi:MAG: hypothetical protein LUE65_09555 [Clostridiales bacterium]|nr:hypothetical protein [Clostridiales bacterium]
MKRERRLSEESRRAYVDGLRRLQQKGVRVLIDGKEADDTLWSRLFESHADGSFYMGDYIMEEESLPQEDTIREEAEPYGDRQASVSGMGGRLKEIRFEMVYHDRKRRKRR